MPLRCSNIGIPVEVWLHPLWSAQMYTIKKQNLSIILGEDWCFIFQKLCRHEEENEVPYLGSNRYWVSSSSSFVQVCLELSTATLTLPLIRLPSCFLWSLLGKRPSADSSFCFTSATLMASSRVFRRSISIFPRRRRAIWHTDRPSISNYHLHVKRTTQLQIDLACM